MSETKKKFYLTTPIYYVNARPHIGHAYTTIAADVIARRHRLLGDDTFFLTGTDEHGQKIERSAALAGIAPQKFADEVSSAFRALWDRMGITYDEYIRTTYAKHKSAVQKLFQVLVDRNAIYLSTYTGQYSVGEEMFVEGPPGTIGPDGKPTETVTEENYFFRLSDYQLRLIDLIESGELDIQPEVRRNEVLSFLRGNISQAIDEGLDSQPGEGASTEPTLRHSASGAPYVPGALKDLSISRTSFKWGIPVPGNEKHVIYVWLDALANYMTAIGYGSDDPAEQEKFKKYWPADLHLVGKEIIRFHCVYWPAFLLAAGLPLPKAITAHGWLLFEDSKMSKSRGNIVRTETILDAFGEEVYGKQFSESTKKDRDLFAADVLRYFLLREIPFGQDGSFSFDALVQRYNSDLANGYGNLVSRTLSMIEKNCGAIIPRPVSLQEDIGLQNSTAVVISMMPEEYTTYSFTRVIASIQSSIGKTDSYFSENAPWKLAKSGEGAEIQRLHTVLYTAAESIRIITALLYPILPYATAKVWAQLGLGDIEAAAKHGHLKNLEWGGLKPGTKLGPLAPIFPRADKGLIQIMTDMEQKSAQQKSAETKALPHFNLEIDNLAEARTEFLESNLASQAGIQNTSPKTAAQQEGSRHTDPTHPAAPPRTSAFNESDPGAQVGASQAISTERTGTPSHAEAPASGIFAAATAASAAPDTPQIAIDDFVKIDLRVAQIVVAERIPKADKLLRLEVDLGYERRQILSGIAQWYTPEELLGKKIVIIANLAPRKMRGLESHGMLLAASHVEDGKPVLATFGEDIALGSRLR